MEDRRGFLKSIGALGALALMPNPVPNAGREFGPSLPDVIYRKVYFYIPNPVDHLRLHLNVKSFWSCTEDSDFDL